MALDWLWGGLIVRLQSMELLRQYNETLSELRCCSGMTSKAALWQSEQSEQSYGHRPEPERFLTDSLTRLGAP